MSKYIIEGGHKLSGEVKVHGAKNSSLPLLAATLLTADISAIENCPQITDLDAAKRILQHLGCEIKQEGNTLIVDTSVITCDDIPDELMREMRSSIVFLGAIVSRLHQCKISFPGGCELGARPIDLHVSSLQQMGLKIEEQHGCLDCFIDGKLKGANIALSFPSVGATENIMIAAALADGETTITNAAREPEIVDLAAYLNKCGARIKGAGESTIVISGVEKLHGCTHRVIPDRIVAATFMSAAAITRGDIVLIDVNPRDLISVIPIFEEMGCAVTTDSSHIYIRCDGRPKAVRTIRTMPYPGFPTDSQALLMAVMSVADGTSVFVENIFENRYKHAAELARLGAKIKVEGKVAIVEGIEQLLSAPVRATDLRGGAAVIIGALNAIGKTEVSGLAHISRGYQNLHETLNELGAQILLED